MASLQRILKIKLNSKFTIFWSFVPEIESNEVPSLLIICHSSQRRYSSFDSFDLFSVVTNLHLQNLTVLSVQAVTSA